MKLKFLQQLVSVVILIGLYIGLGSLFQVGASPPEPQAQKSTHKPEALPNELVAVESITMTLTAPVAPTTDEIQSFGVIFNENFEGPWPNGNWEIEDLSNTDGGDYKWGRRNCFPRTGSYATWSVGGGDQGDSLPCSSNYPNNVSSWAIYGPFNLSNAPGASLTYHYRGQIEGGTNCPFDVLAVMSSIDGINFSGQGHCGNATNGPYGNGYHQDTLDLTHRLGQSQVWIAFVFESDSTIAFNGVTIDDISLDIIDPCPDNYEPDNTANSAKTILVNGTIQAHTIHIVGDEDWVKFTATAGKHYIITTSNLGGNNDTYIYLYGTDGATLLDQDDDGGPGLGSQIIWMASGNGVYYVRVQRWGNTAGGCSGYSYDLNIVEESVELIYLPFVIRSPAPSPPGSPAAGFWTGTTSRGQPMSFIVASGGGSWNTFTLRTDFNFGSCSGTIETTMGGPGSITNRQFSGASGSFSFSGSFGLSTTASGTYAYTNYTIPGCGSLTQSGTWTASR